MRLIAKPCPQMLEVGEVLATQTLEDLVHATKWQSFTHRLEQKAITQVLHSKWLDDNTASGTEVKSRLVATEVAYGNRDD